MSDLLPLLLLPPMLLAFAALVHSLALSAAGCNSCRRREGRCCCTSAHVPGLQPSALLIMIHQMLLLHQPISGHYYTVYRDMYCLGFIDKVQVLFCWSALAQCDELREEQELVSRTSTGASIRQPSLPVLLPVSFLLLLSPNLLAPRSLPRGRPSTTSSADHHHHRPSVRR